jgi:hypothetical protein
MTIITTTSSKFVTVHTMLKHVRSLDLVPPIPNLRCKCQCLVKITSRKLHPFESTPEPIIHETVWPPSDAGYYRENNRCSPRQEFNSRSSTPELGHSSNYIIPVKYCKLSKSLLTIYCMSQRVPQLFKNMPTLPVTYSCFAIIKKIFFRKNNVRLQIFMLMFSFLNQHVCKIFLQYT